ncbi:amidase signature domain-containing protein [Fusarium venenatum]|uniref:amidase signature domain-containing protein n=1 Tax=Fusarium venenatum TaxID=56646 RepID=UPI001DF6022D|nr:amidase signature domain-containing protein [Fusarium venenatum]
MTTSQPVTLASAFSQGHVNSVELTVKHLLRIAKYDRRTSHLNAVPIINHDAFDAAQESDQRRASGKMLGPLDGIPGTIKDSYKMKGMTVAAGSPAFNDLIVNEDAFTVQKLKEAGAVLLGRTNMPPMAAGESPYNEAYLTAAFASGSSDGSATATAASFGVFGMGEETISSGRSSASNNGLVAYTSSRGLISIRANWPLFATCDTVVPHTRTVDDMFALLDIIVAKDPKTSCDFWSEQTYVKLPEVDTIRLKSFFDLSDPNALKDKRVGVPKIKVHTRQSILEGLGATVIETGFPLLTKFEKPEASGNVSETPPHRNEIDICQLMAYTCDDFLASNQDNKIASTLAQVKSSTIFPHPPGCLQDKYDSNDPLVRHTAVVAHITNGRLDDMGLDTVVCPCNADVGKADADVNEQSAKHAWLNAVLYSNGNCAIRQFGIPTVTVPMGVMADIGMPVNLTFASKTCDDNNLFRYAYAFEKHSQLHNISRRGSMSQMGLTAPQLSIETSASIIDGQKVITISGTINKQEVSELKAHVDGEEMNRVNIVDGKWEVKSYVPDFESTMLIVVATGKDRRSTAKMAFV